VESPQEHCSLEAFVDNQASILFVDPLRCFSKQRFIFSLRANVEMLLSPDFGVLCNHLPGVNDNINY